MRAARPWPVFLVGALCVHLAASGVVVSVESQSQESMAAITARVDAESELPLHGSNRVALGAIEATMSRVVDSESLYAEEAIRHMPLMARMSDMTFEDGSWTITYQSMARSGVSATNAFNRILYFTRKEQPTVTGDVQNPMLQPALSRPDALDRLKAGYLVASNASYDEDFVTFDSADGITASISAAPEYSLRESIRISIPHDYLIKHMAVKGLDYDGPEHGNTTTWTFGIGMVFTTDHGQNVVMFDRLHLYERNTELFEVRAETRYSLAQHVEFYALQVPDTEIQIAVFHFALAAGMQVEDTVYTSVAGKALAADACAGMQTLVDDLTDKRCLVSFELCKLRVRDVGGAQAVSYAVPVHELGKVNIMLNVTDVSDAGSPLTLITSLNFKLSSASAVCQPEVVKTHDPLKWVGVDVYSPTATGLGVGQRLSGAAGSGTLSSEVYNSAGEFRAKIMSQALLTVVIASTGTPAAQAYFNSANTQELRLDHVLMSHARGGSALPAPPSRVKAVSGENFRAQMAYTESEDCRRERDSTPSTATCVTTEDWTLDGQQLRPKRKGTTEYFVHEVGASVPDNTDFLRRVFGGSINDPLDAVINARVRVHLDATMALRSPDDTYTKIYWVWPVYNWDQSPIGLADKTLISLAWSVSSRTGGRRLLGTGLARWERRTAQSGSAAPVILLNSVQARCAYCGNITTAILPDVRRGVRPPRIEMHSQALAHKAAQHVAARRARPPAAARDMLAALRRRRTRREKTAIA